MSVKGDSKAAKKLAEHLARLSEKVSAGDLAKVLGETSRELVDDGFKRGVAPDGTPWAPLAIRDGQPLRDTRRLQASFTYIAEPSRVEVGTNVQYAPIHQFGGEIEPVTAKMLAFSVGGRKFFAHKVKIPARPMLPLGSLPSRWARKLKRAAEDFVSDTVPA